MFINLLSSVYPTKHNLGIMLSAITERCFIRPLPAYVCVSLCALLQVATQLGLLDDAVRLYRECGRYDLLNRLYQVRQIERRGAANREMSELCSLRLKKWKAAAFC